MVTCLNLEIQVFFKLEQYSRIRKNTNSKSILITLNSQIHWLEKLKLCGFFWWNRNAYGYF